MMHNHMEYPPPGSSQPAFRQLLAAGEPYRLLFPLGAALGVVGVMLWPGYVWLGMTYPVVSHAGIMIQGFLAAFVIGFLGTALPRLLEVSRLTLTESCAYGALLLIISALHLMHKPLAANIFFLVMLTTFFTSLGWRARKRKDTPPPGFVLVLLGLICALTGTGLLIIDALVAGGLSYGVYRLAQLLLYQGFLLLPIMGIGAFLLPRFFGLPNRQAFPESMKLPPGWIGRAVFALLCGLCVLISFGLESWGAHRSGFFLRALAIGGYFFREVPLHQAAFGQGSLAWALRIAMLSVPVGYLAMGLFPTWQMGLLHIVLINGFSLLTFTVATRVIYGHSGQDALFKATLKPVIAFTALFIIAMATRVFADWMPAIRLSHYGYASLSWALAVLVWAVWIMPGVRRSAPS